MKKLEIKEVCCSKETEIFKDRFVKMFVDVEQKLLELDHNSYLLKKEKERAERFYDLIEGLANQFAPDVKVKGKHCRCTSGIQVLEEAFDILGWDDPMPVEKIDELLEKRVENR